MTQTIEQRINQSTSEALRARQDYTAKAIFVGQLLIEKRHDSCACKPCTRKNRATIPENQFDVWLQHNITQISRRTAYNWMAAAERVVKLWLGLPAKYPTQTTHEKSGVLISDILSDNTPAGFQALKAEFLALTKDMTLAEAAVAVLDGESEGHRITRASNGKTEGGTRGEPRNNFPVYIARKFSDFSQHINHWEKMNESQKLDVRNVLRASIIGQDLEIPGYDKLFKFTAWPDELIATAKAAFKDHSRKSSTSADA